MENQTTTTGTSTSHVFNPACKYYLPCGKCDKTGEMCLYYYWRPDNPGLTSPNPWGWEPTWIYKDSTTTGE